MKKLFALILALCLTVGLLPMAAMAETTAPAEVETTAPAEVETTAPAATETTAPQKVTVTFQHAAGAKLNKKVTSGQTLYVISNADMTVSDWTDAENAPADNFIKLSYDQETAILNVTMQNFKADMTPAGGYTCHGIQFPGDDSKEENGKEGDYAINIELIGENLLHHGKSACIKSNNNGGMTITGTEGSSLTLNMGLAEAFGSAAGTLWANGGDLVIKNTTLNFNIYTSTTSQHNGILSSKGNVLLENLTINNVMNNGGQLVFTGLATAKDVRFTQDPDETRTVTVKDCKINSDSGGAIFRTTSPVTLINTELKAVTRNAPLFTGMEKTINAPVIEGEFTAVAGLKANANKPNKLKEYNPKKLASYTYLNIVPGLVELIPTEATEPEETVAPTEKPEETKPEETKPEETKPEATTPEATTPEATTPEATTPEATTPEESKPEATTPEASTPDASTPEESKPEASTPADDDAKEEKSGSPLKVILIVLIALIVVAGAAVGVIFYLRNKNAEYEDEDEDEEEEEEEE